MKTTILSAIAIVLFATANAQVSTTQTVTLDLKNQIDITIQSAGGTNFSFATTNDYASGLTNGGASTIRVRSNKDWNVTVASNAEFFSIGATTSAMPASVLSVSLKDANNFKTLNTTQQAFTNGNKGGSNEFSVDYKANPGFDFSEGIYTIGVVYTATQK